MLLVPAPVRPEPMLAPWPRTVELATPLSLAELPTTKESAPVAVAPLPPALESFPVAVGLAALE
jgi:hypothetical protein